MTAKLPANSDDIQTMILVARAIVAKRPLPHMSVEGLIVALARTILILAPEKGPGESNFEKEAKRLAERLRDAAAAIKQEKNTIAALADQYFDPADQELYQDGLAAVWLSLRGMYPAGSVAGIKIEVAEKEIYRSRWLSCVTAEEAQRLRDAAAAIKQEKNTIAALADERSKEIERLLEQLRQAEKVAKAAGALISADIKVHPMMSRDEAVNSSYLALDKAVNEYRSALPAAVSPDFDPRRAQKEE